MSLEEYHARRRDMVRATVEDVEDLLEGEPWMTQRAAAERLGLTQHALVKRLDRSGRHDLTARLGRNHPQNTSHLRRDRGS